jgi:hypothetical protein
VPNDPFLAAGLTFPRIKLGKLSGQILIDKGKGRFEGVRVHSVDGDATLDGYVELRDPIGMSQMHAYLKFRPSEALLKREATLELMTNALSGTAKRSDGYLGIQLTGPLSALFALPSKDPPFGVTSSNGESPAPTPAPVAAPRPTIPQAAPVFNPPAQPPAQLPPPPPSNPAPEPSPGAPSCAPATPPSGVIAPPSGAPPSGGGTEIGPAPTGGTVGAPPPALRNMKAEPLEPQAPAKTE